MNNSFNIDFLHSLVCLLIEKKKAVSIAESCTGGLLASLITSVPGSSASFPGSIVAYTVDSKVELLDLNRDTIIKEGVVSKKTALAMSKQVRLKFNSDYGISTTGYAGPGHTSNIPVGTVFISLSSDRESIVEECHFDGNRNEVRLEACKKALEMLNQHLLNLEY